MLETATNRDGSGWTTTRKPASQNPVSPPLRPRGGVSPVSRTRPFLAHTGSVSPRSAAGLLQDRSVLRSYPEQVGTVQLGVGLDDQISVRVESATT
jgi:hypothetical protein